MTDESTPSPQPVEAFDAAPPRETIPKLGERPPEPKSTGPTAVRFTVRFLLLVMLLAAGYAGWYGYTTRRTEQQLRFVEPLQQYGATVNVWKGQVNRVTLSRDLDKPFDPELLAPLAKLPKLTRLVLIDTQGDEQMIEQIGRIESLEELLIINADLNRADLAPLKQLTNLKILWLCDSNLNDSTLDPIGEMQSLRRLNLNDNRLTDNGLLRLAGLVSLEQLHLANNEITDNGVNLVQQTLANVRIVREPITGYQP